MGNLSSCESNEKCYVSCCEKFVFDKNHPDTSFCHLLSSLITAQICWKLEKPPIFCSEMKNCDIMYHSLLRR